MLGAVVLWGPCGRGGSGARGGRGGGGDGAMVVSGRACKASDDARGCGGAGRMLR